MKNRALPVTLFTLIILSALYGKEGINLQWEGNADHTYQIELQKDGTPLFVERLSEPAVTLDLTPGEYSYRITFFNKFDKPDAQTDWIILTVLKDLTPVVLDIPEHRVFAGDKRQRVEVRTADIMEGAEIWLEKDGVSTYPEYRMTGGNTLELTLETKNMEAGFYDLHILNPSGSGTVAEKGIQLREKRNPRIGDMNPHTAELGTQLPDVRIYGENLAPDMVAFLQQNGKRYRMPLNEYINENELSLWFNLEGLKAGVYDLVLINPPLEETSVAGAFTIVDPREIRDTAFYESLKTGTDLLIGFPLPDVILDTSVFNYTFEDNSGLFSPFPEIELIIKSDLNGNSPLLQYFGWQGRIAVFPPNDKGVRFNTITMGFYGRTRYVFPLNLFAEANMGYRNMRLEIEGEMQDGDGTLLSWGLGMTLNYDRYLIELSGRRDTWLMSRDTVNLTQLSLRMGYRF